MALIEEFGLGYLASTFSGATHGIVGDQRGRTLRLYCAKRTLPARGSPAEASFEQRLALVGVTLAQYESATGSELDRPGDFCPDAFQGDKPVPCSNGRDRGAVKACPVPVSLNPCLV